MQEVSASHVIHGIRDIILLFCAAAAGSAQVYRPGAQVVTYFSTVDDTDQPYGLYVPKSHDPSRPYPLVVSLHDAQSNHRLNLRRVFGKGSLPGQTEAEASRMFPVLPDVPFLVATPLARGTMGYQGLAERDVYDVIADVKKRFLIDDDRVYLTGIAMGGGGALWLGLTRPDVWAAIAALCPTPPPGTWELAANALHMPVRLFHGVLDPLTPVEESRSWHKQLLDAGVAVEYLEYPVLRHNVWDTVYKDAAIFEWFGKHRRNRFPDRVRFMTGDSAHRSAYWVHLEQITPGTIASIDARVADPNTVSVEMKNVEDFTLDLAGHPAMQPGKPVQVTVNGKPWKRPAPVRPVQRWEGPIRQVFSARHLYVYGTADNPSPEERERRRGIAKSAADAFREKTNLDLPVVADRDVEERDLLTANLVLFGTRETNRWLSFWADRLPMHLNPGAADYGLAYVANVGVTRVLVSSGLPWWTGGQGSARYAAAWPSPMQRLLATLPDFVLFRGSLDGVVSEGYFGGGLPEPCRMSPPAPVACR